MMMRPPLNGATPEKPVGFGFYYMTSTLEAKHTLSCPPNQLERTRTPLCSAVVRCTHCTRGPSSSRGALETLHSAVLPPRPWCLQHVGLYAAQLLPHHPRD